MNPRFAQAERRPLLIPILLALVLLGAAAAVARHFFPATSIDIDHLHTELLPTHTVFSNDSKVIGTGQSEDVLFVATTLRVHNGMQVPIFLDDFTCTFTNQAGQILPVRAVQRRDLSNIETSFPKLTPLMRNALPRDTTIDPGQSASGTVLFSLPFTPAQWQARRSALIEVDVYHQHPVYLTIPNPEIPGPGRKP